MDRRSICSILSLLLYVASIKGLQRVQTLANIMSVFLHCSIPITTPDLLSPACTEDVNPTRTIVTCKQVGFEENMQSKGLRGCKSTENCFSTSSKTAAKRIQPWHYSSSISEEDAFKILSDALQLEGLKILQSKPVDLYILAAKTNVAKQPPGSSLFYEFLLKPADKVVLTRAVVDKTVFVYPLQQPVSDFNALKGKLSAVLRRTGFYTDEDMVESTQFRSPFLFQ